MSMYGVGTHRRIFNTSWTEVGHSVFDHPEIDLTNSLDQLATKWYAARKDFVPLFRLNFFSYRESNPFPFS